MRAAAILFLIVFCGCYEPEKSETMTVVPGKFPAGVVKFYDGNVTCYVYFQNAISCVR